MKKRISKKMQEKVAGILGLLDEHYPAETKCHLDYDPSKPWQLLIATILSAQCTDARVNIVTKDLFAKYPSLEAFAAADLQGLEEDIHSTGFYHHKAKNILESSRMLLVNYDGQLPSEMEELLKLPGVGRKTANVVRGHIFGIDSIVVDTHVKRLSTKLGLATHTDPDKIEFELMDILPQNHWIAYNTQIIVHGRNVCIARRPRCEACFLQPYCSAYAKSKTTRQAKKGEK